MLESRNTWVSRITWENNFSLQVPAKCGNFENKFFNDNGGDSGRLACHATACRALSWPTTLRHGGSSDGVQGATDDALLCETRLDRRRSAPSMESMQCRSAGGVKTAGAIEMEDDKMLSSCSRSAFLDVTTQIT